MKIIKTGTILTTHKGEALKDSDKNDLTLGAVISTILSGKVSNPTLGWSLGKKFATEKEVDLKIEDAAFIKKELESEHNPYLAVVTGQVIELLESSDDEKKK